MANSLEIMQHDVLSKDSFILPKPLVWSIGDSPSILTFLFSMNIENDDLYMTLNCKACQDIFNWYSHMCLYLVSDTCTVKSFCGSM